MSSSRRTREPAVSSGDAIRERGGPGGGRAGGHINFRGMPALLSMSDLANVSGLAVLGERLNQDLRVKADAPGSLVCPELVPGAPGAEGESLVSSEEDAYEIVKNEAKFRLRSMLSEIEEAKRREVTFSENAEKRKNEIAREREYAIEYAREDLEDLGSVGTVPTSPEPLNEEVATPDRGSTSGSSGTERSPQQVKAQKNYDAAVKKANRAYESQMVALESWLLEKTSDIWARTTFKSVEDLIAEVYDATMREAYASLRKYLREADFAMLRNELAPGLTDAAKFVAIMARLESKTMAYTARSAGYDMAAFYEPLPGKDLSLKEVWDCLHGRFVKANAGAGHPLVTSFAFVIRVCGVMERNPMLSHLVVKYSGLDAKDAVVAYDQDTISQLYKDLQPYFGHGTRIRLRDGQAGFRGDPEKKIKDPEVGAINKDGLGGKDRNKPEPKDAPGGDGRRGVKCYNCGKFGHIARYCPGDSPSRSTSPFKAPSVSMFTLSPKEIEDLKEPLPVEESDVALEGYKSDAESVAEMVARSTVPLLETFSPSSDPVCGDCRIDVAVQMDDVGESSGPSVAVQAVETVPVGGGQPAETAKSKSKQKNRRKQRSRDQAQQSRKPHGAPRAIAVKMDSGAAVSVCQNMQLKGRTPQSRAVLSFAGHAVPSEASGTLEMDLECNRTGRIGRVEVHAWDVHGLAQDSKPSNPAAILSVPQFVRAGATVVMSPRGNFVKLPGKGRFYLDDDFNAKIRPDYRGSSAPVATASVPKEEEDGWITVTRRRKARKARAPRNSGSGEGGAPQH